MKFTRINNKLVERVQFDELVQFFVEHTFVKFMEMGREGMRVAAVDIVDNVESYTAARIPGTRLTSQQFEALYFLITRELMNGFIQQGSAGLNQPIRLASQLIATYIHENKLTSLKEAEMRGQL